MSRRRQFEVVRIPTSYILVLLSIGSNKALAQDNVSEDIHPTQQREGGRRFPFPLLSDVEFVGVPIIRDKDDMATLATFLRVRSYFGYKLQRLYIQGSGFADEDMVMLSTLVDVTNTDSLVGV